MRERIMNAQNYNQRYDKYQRVLCICSGGLLRSPTTAWVLANDPFNYNTRSAGIDSHHALTLVDDVIVEWADIIVVMNKTQKHQLLEAYDLKNADKLIVVMNLPDRFQYRDPELVQKIKDIFPFALADARKEQTIGLQALELLQDPREDGKGPPIPPANTTPTLW